MSGHTIHNWKTCTYLCIQYVATHGHTDLYIASCGYYSYHIDNRHGKQCSQSFILKLYYVYGIWYGNYVKVATIKGATFH